MIIPVHSATVHFPRPHKILVLLYNTTLAIFQTHSKGSIPSSTGLFGMTNTLQTHVPYRQGLLFLQMHLMHCTALHCTVHAYVYTADTTMFSNSQAHANYRSDLMIQKVSTGKCKLYVKDSL